MNRIVSGQTTATTGSTCWGETYTLDQWANLTAIGALSGYTGCTQDNLSVSVNANNHLSGGFTYDSAGNLQFTPAPGTASYTYNAESELVQSSVNTEAGYVYDGDGNRLEKTNGVQPTKIYWYGAGTEILDESDGSGNFTNEYVFFGGKRIAMRTVSSGNIYYYEEDMLGSSRTMVQAGQTSVCFDADFLPFGSEKDVTTTCTQNYKFEGKERDTETNNDDFGARYYSSQYGRWLSADWSSVPEPVPYANLTNPQTLNLYSMVSDNPESFADLDGHCGHLIMPGAASATEPCENPGANTHDDEGEGNSGINFDENTGIPDWYRAEVSAASTQLAAQQAAKRNANQKKKKTDDKPAKFVIVPSETTNEGYYSRYHYKLENKEGVVLTGGGYSVEEHISGNTPVPQETSEGQFSDVVQGEIQDSVGKAAPPPPGYSQDSVVYQTFTVRYKNQNYNLVTKFKHEVVVSHGVVTTTVTDVTGEK